MENWKPIRGFEDHYEVSDLGRVRRIKPYNNSPIGRILKNKFAGAGYCQVLLYVKNRHYPRYVHRLVADAFIQELHKGDEINHKDMDKRNNSIHNLEVCSRRRNCKHAFDNGVINLKHVKGVDHWKASITDDTVRAIRKMKAETKLSARLIGAHFGCSRDVVSNITTGRHWSHVK